jgi:hypothetical protein
VCQRPVDRLEWYDDWETDDRVIIAHCHGQKQEMRLTQLDLYRMHSINMIPTEGVAFDTVLLMPPEERKQA